MRCSRAYFLLVLGLPVVAISGSCSRIISFGKYSWFWKVKIGRSGWYRLVQVRTTRYVKLSQLFIVVFV